MSRIDDSDADSMQDMQNNQGSFLTAVCAI